MQALGLTVTYRCTARCAHCAYGCGPEAEGYMEGLQARTLLAGGRQLGASLLCVSGGEPFVHPAGLVSILEEAGKAGFPDVWVFTNGFWATDREPAARIVAGLKQLGVTRLMLSADAFHSPYVPVRRVLLLGQVATEAGLEVEVDCRLGPPGSQHETAALIDQVRELPGVRVHATLPWPVGRAAALFAGGELPDSPGAETGPCTRTWTGGDLRSPAGVDVDVNGYVSLCPGLAMGRTGRRSLVDVVRSYRPEAHPVIRVLLEEGPVGLARMAGAKGYRPSAPPGSQCQLCYDARRFLRPHFEEYLGPANCYPEQEAVT